MSDGDEFVIECHHRQDEQNWTSTFLRCAKDWSKGASNISVRSPACGSQPSP